MHVHVCPYCLHSVAYREGDLAPEGSPFKLRSEWAQDLMMSHIANHDEYDDEAEADRG